MTARFDHIAYGVEDPLATFPTLRAVLGMSWVQWDHNVGFSGLQAAFPNGFKIEVLHPVDHERNPFLRRFLDRRGNGPHHLTFRVRDIESYLERVRRLGFEPVAVNLDDPAWREAFVHPRGGIGILVQLAESDNDKHTDEPHSWSALPAGEPVTVLRVEQYVADLERAVALMTALDGEAQERGLDDDGPFVDLVWQGDRVLRLRPLSAGTDPDGAHRAVVVADLPAGSCTGGVLVEAALGARFETGRP